MDETTIGIIVVVICLFISSSISSSIGIFFSTTMMAPTTTTRAPKTTTRAPTTTTFAPTTTTFAPTTTTFAPTTTTFAPTTTTRAPTTTTRAPTTTTPYTGCWNCYLNTNKTRQDSWNDAGNGGGLCGYSSQNDASNTCNAWISNCGNMGGCTAYKVGQKPS